MKKTKEYYEQEADLEEFLQWYQTQDQPKYEKPSVTVDMVILTPDKQEILVIERRANPYKGHWALPGGFVNPKEPSEMAASREVMEETNILVPQQNIQQFYTFTTPNRDPRGWVISIAYLAILPNKPKARPADDAKRARWMRLDEVLHLPLAFDHKEIIKKALENV